MGDYECILKCDAIEDECKIKLRDMDKDEKLYKAISKEKINKSEIEKILSEEHNIWFDYITDYRSFAGNIYADILECNITLGKVIKDDKYLILSNIHYNLVVNLSTERFFDIEDDTEDEESIEVNDGTIIDIISEYVQYTPLLGVQGVVSNDANSLYTSWNFK